MEKLSLLRGPSPGSHGGVLGCGVARPPSTCRPRRWRGAPCGSLREESLICCCVDSLNPSELTGAIALPPPPPTHTHTHAAPQHPPPPRPGAPRVAEV